MILVLHQRQTAHDRTKEWIIRGQGSVLGTFLKTRPFINTVPADGSIFGQKWGIFYY